MRFGTSGAAITQIFHLPQGVFAAFGFVALPAGAANTPIDASVMGIELLRGPVGVYAALCACSAYLMVGHRSVYASQKLGIPKSVGLEMPMDVAIGEALTGETNGLLPLASTPSQVACWILERERVTEPFHLTIGATYLGQGRTRFRVWAPKRRKVEVAIEADGRRDFFSLAPDGAGYFAGTGSASPGTHYKFRLDEGEAFPDPCSRFQPEGPHGPSQVVDPSVFSWSDSNWKGVGRSGHVIYELHIGAFTPQGTYRSAVPHLAALKELGITLVEVMPVHTFPGRFNWGYDGVTLFAPCAVYGSPDDLRLLVNEAHRIGLGVLLDVVYNHLGPDGNYLSQYSDSYFTDRHPAEWGQPINFDGENSQPVRDLFIQNACYWISEFHFDGLRLDATHSIYDSSPNHVLKELGARARAAAEQRGIFLAAENEAQDVRHVLPASEGGFGLDAMWIDDFHHAARVAVTSQAEAFWSDFRGTAQELLSCAQYNALYQGQWSQWKKQPRGTPLLNVPAQQMIFFLQNHDQVAYHLRGQRIHQLRGEPLARALTAYLLLLPQTPLLFMGQEFFASSPFFYFTDHSPPLQDAVRKGREEFLRRAPSVDRAIRDEGFHPPIGEDGFRQSKLNHAERNSHAWAWALHRELLKLRREDPVFSAHGGVRLAGELLSDDVLVLRFFGVAGGGDRLLVLNLGSELRLSPSPLPLLAPPAGSRWRLILSSEESRFGGAKDFSPTAEPWTVPAHCTLVLGSAAQAEPLRR